MLSAYYHNYLSRLIRKLFSTGTSLFEISNNPSDLKKSISHRNRKYELIILTNRLSMEIDVSSFISSLRKISYPQTKIVVFYFNFAWKPLLDFAQTFGLKKKDIIEPNWLSEEDIDNFFYLKSFEKIKTSKFFLLPVSIPFVSEFVNRYFSQAFFFNRLCLMNMSIYRQTPENKPCSVSIIIPARNEEGNIRGILDKIPLLGTKTEVIFVEGHSHDYTFNVIKEEIRRYKGKLICSLYKQTGRGKGDAVRLGFSKAKNDLLMILDADLTVPPFELHKFYEAYLQNRGELIMGSRLVYPMDKQAMRTLNILGNKIFSLLFTFLLGQKIKDTLCGTKVILRSNYEKIASQRRYFGNFDPFGDYDLIFGAVRQNMKILEIPIRYKQRVYGRTNISRFYHGLLLLRMVVFAARKIKFI